MINQIRTKLSGIDKPTVLFALASAWQVIGFLPTLPSTLVYVISITYAVYCLGRANGIEIMYVVLLTYIPIELLMAQPSSVFHSWQRYLFFAALLVNVSPFLQSDRLRQQRKTLFQIMMWVSVFIGVGSFFARFLGINYMRSISRDTLSAGSFGGLTIQSMMLGPIAGIAACYLTSKAMSSKRFIDWIWVVLSIGSVLFSASRSALMATLTGIVVTVYCQSGSTSKFLRVCIISLAIAAFTMPLWEDSLSGVIEKNGSTSSLSLESRQELWQRRIDDFKASPIYGVGFCATTVQGANEVDLITGRIESGSSWIIVFSMLGIIGACIIIPLFYKSIMTAYKRRDDVSSIVCGVLSLFFVHMFAEGYIFAGGSFLAFMLWLTVGIAIDRKYQVEQ